MKKLFFLLLLLSFQIGIAQAPLSSVELNIHPAVQIAYNNLVERSTAHNVDYNAKLKSAGLIEIKVVDSLPCGNMGAYNRTGATFTVTIIKKVLKDPISLEWTLAHELAHGLGLEHETPPLPDGTYKWSAEIMSGSGPLDKRHIIYQIMTHPSYAPGIWERYFSQL